MFVALYCNFPRSRMQSPALCIHNPSLLAPVALSWACWLPWSVLSPLPHHPAADLPRQTPVGCHPKMCMFRAT
ncbi:hypothetical protein P153DRAFT_366350 [Dothidotthia symphoricarpi CBS 119687]|uniref:Uncharacterized protein n=1 Tax=Dothidotthia symphoricarpi CBS 119687 TaxID=1392245 RepID=A0A6A6AD68_9PLEO|nr:uncharacterized protein P153DRAFT_366350 [Dothidotthia symphoricarpi CBS 119687]KAF2129842.1 hypothetical protein P153DRAFT_366350 [Dothidotthia symphoricarpi CBS 119687]